jgi:hypothetical protein
MHQGKISVPLAKPKFWRLPSSLLLSRLMMTVVAEVDVAARVAVEVMEVAVDVVMAVAEVVLVVARAAAETKHPVLPARLCFPTSTSRPCKLPVYPGYQ